MKKLPKLVIVASCIVFFLVGCGSKNETSKEQVKQSAETNYPVTIKNIGRTEATAPWLDVEQTFEKAPERVLANTRPAAELLLRLGLKDHIVAVGASFGKADPDVVEDYETLKILANEYINREVALGEDPDLIMGRADLFDNAEWGVGTVSDLNGMGIPTYVLASSAEGGTYDTIYEDIENLGELFNVQENGVALIKELKAQQQGLEAKMANVQEEKTFALMFMTEPTEPKVYPAKEQTFFNDLFRMVKLDNIYKEVEGEVSLEKLIETDPDILIIPDWRHTDGVAPDAIKKGLYDNPKLSSLSAVKNKQIYALDYNDMFGYGYIAIVGIEELAKELYPDLF